MNTQYNKEEKYTKNYNEFSINWSSICNLAKKETLRSNFPKTTIFLIPMASNLTEKENQISADLKEMVRNE